MKMETKIHSDDIELTPDVPLVAKKEKKGLITCNQLDTGWAWVILFSAFMLSFVVGMQMATFSVFYAEFSEVFDASLAEVGWIPSINFTTAYVTGLFAGVLVNIWGVRCVAVLGCILCGFGNALCSVATDIKVVCLTYGVISGAGFGMFLLASAITVQKWFDKKRPLAAGIAICGEAIGSAVGGVVLQIFIDTYTLRGTELIHGAICIQGTVFALMLLPAPPTPGAEKEINKKQSTLSIAKNSFKMMWNWKLLTNITFIFYEIGIFLGFIGLVAYFNHLVNWAVDNGISRSQASLLPGIVNSVVLVARIITSFVSNLPNMKREIIFALGHTLAGLICCLSTLATDFTTIAICSTVYGIAHSLYSTTQTTVLGDLLGVELIVSSQGLTHVTIGIAGLIATPFAGWLHDISHSYTLPYLVCGSIQMLGGCFLWLIVIDRMRKQSRMKMYLQSANSFG